MVSRDRGCTDFFVPKTLGLLHIKPMACTRTRSRRRKRTTVNNRHCSLLYVYRACRRDETFLWHLLRAKWNVKPAHSFGFCLLGLLTEKTYHARRFISSSFYASAIYDLNVQLSRCPVWQAELTFIRFFQISKKKLFWISEKEFVISEILAH